MREQCGAYQPRTNPWTNPISTTIDRPHAVLTAPTITRIIRFGTLPIADPQRALRGYTLCQGSYKRGLANACLAHNTSQVAFAPLAFLKPAGQLAQLHFPVDEQCPRGGKPSKDSTGPMALKAASAIVSAGS